MSTIIDSPHSLEDLTNSDDLLQLTLTEAESLAPQWLQNFAQSPDFAAKMQLAFGKAIDVSHLQAAWQAGDFSELPPIEVHPAADINGSHGAYAATVNTL